MRNPRKAAGFIVAALFAAGLFLFYKKYVPLVPGFQLLYLPACLAVGGLAAWNFRTGTLAFLFAFPIVNNWPYFFGLDESIPQSPAALGLFLFYTLGWLAHRGRKGRPTPSRNPVSRPMALAAAVVGVSALITAWRFTNFYPLAAGRVYELVTNVNGVTAGGALMSTLFHALNYLTGMIFFVFLCGLMDQAAFRMQALTVVSISLLLSVLFGNYQNFLDPAAGNTAFWAGMGQINATFKDPNAFGAVLAMFTPLAAGAVFQFRGWRRFLSGLLAVAAVIIFPFIGARSALLGLGAGLLIMAVAWGIWKFRKMGAAAETETRQGLTRKRSLRAAAAIAGLLIVVLGVAFLGKAKVFQRLSQSVKLVSSGSGLVGLSPERYFLWKEALDMARDYPLTGVGAGAYIIELPNYYTKDTAVYPAGFENLRRNDSAENYFLQAGAEFGLIGLLALLWMLWSIVRLAGRGYRRGGPAWGPDRYLYWGTSAGLLAYILNIVFHSYIGSFETVYGFWFLAALAVGLSGHAGIALPSDAASSSSPRRRTPRFFIGVLLVFIGIHAWNSSHSLSLAARTREFRLIQNFGLYQAEKTADGRDYHWTREYGGVALKIEGPVIRIPLQASHPDLQTLPVTAELFWIKGLFKEKTRLGKIAFRNGEWTVREYPVADFVGQEGILLVTVSRTWIPLGANGTPDPRRLGVAIGAVTFPK